MEQERRSIRIGLAVIACAVVLRLAGSGPVEAVAAFFSQPEVASVLVFLETGRFVRTGEVSGQTEIPETTAEASQPEQGLSVPQGISFQAEDAQLVEVSAICSYDVDVEAMLQAPLAWDLTQGGPTVLILHSHATEGYTKAAGQTYTESSPYRTLDEQYNVVRVGEYLAELLQAGGVEVIHDRALHDYPDYSGSYADARKTIAQYLQTYPSIRMVLDIHRDALDMSSEIQLSTEAVVNGQASSQLMMVVGTDAGGSYHPRWQENMALAVKLHTQLEKTHPGICRPISFRTQRFNQDLSAGAMIVEVGAAGDTLEEALTATRALAEGILALAGGTKADSTS